MKIIEGDQPLTVCHIVAYKDPNYVRTRTLRAALSAIDGCRIVDATNTRPGWRGYIEAIRKVFTARVRENPDVYLLGFRGYEIFWIVRLITVGKKLVFDAFLSPSDVLISEKKFGNTGKLFGYLVYPFEYLCLRFSDGCITDTQSHKAFFIDRFRLPPKKMNVVYVGAVPDCAITASRAAETPADSAEPLNVLFYGTFLPLHGTDVILNACKLLEEKRILIHIIGGKGRALTEFLRQLKQLKLRNVHHEKWVDFDKLQSTYIPRAELCLGGPFGGTPQAQRVITGKTFQFLMQGKATVIGAITERVGFIDRKNCLLVPQSDPTQLADALNWAIINRHLLPEIGLQGQALFEQHFSATALAKKLYPALRRDT